MKKTLFAVTVLLAVVMLAAVSASAMTLDEGKTALKGAETFDKQLEILYDLSIENADELETGGWNVSLRVDAAPGLPEGLIPENWDDFKADKASGIPEEYRGHKFIALYSNGKDDVDFAGSFLARFPENMRARSLAEAEYALVIRAYWTPSGYRYIPAGSSSHRDYTGYIFDLKNGGNAVSFWSHRNYAKRSGRIGQLSGDNLSDSSMWLKLRTAVWGTISLPQADGSTLLFSTSGKYSYLYGYKGDPVSIEVPASVDGHPLHEVADGCFQNCKTLQSVVLPEGLQSISGLAFRNCENLTEVKLPTTLEYIGGSAFSVCSKLKSVRLPEGIREIQSTAFYSNHALTELVLPGSVTTFGDKVVQSSEKLASVTVSEGIKALGGSFFDNVKNLACVYLPASLEKNTGLASISNRAAVYAPEGSYALKWAQDNGYKAVACATAAEMPKAEYVTVDGFEFRIFNGEAALFRYLGQDAVVAVPETAAGCPVTTILNHAVYSLDHVKIVNLPRSVTAIVGSAIYAPDKKVPLEIYIPNPETVIEAKAIGRYGSGKTPVTIYAPEGSLAQRYVLDTEKDEPVEFEPWGEAVDLNIRSIKDALRVAEKLQQSVNEFWADCDQQEYGWLGFVPSYDVKKPDFAAVLRFPQSQYNELALLMSGRENVAKTFATIVNTQWNLPYAKASAQTAQTDQFDLVQDGSCAIVVLAYRADLIVAALQSDGSAQAALVFCSPADIRNLTAETVSGIAARYGVTGECKIYGRDALAEIAAE